MKTRYEIGVIIALLFISTIITFAIRHDYSIPIHSDEYDHLAVINEMQKTESTVWYDPYIVEQRAAQRNLELNYDIFLLAFANITGIELINVPLVFPTIITFLMLLGTFVLVRFVTNKATAGLLAAIFVLFLHNNIALLGYWFLVPMAIGLAVVPIMLFLFLKALNSWSYTIMLFLVIINMTLMHAVYTVIVLPAFFLFLISTPQEIKKNALKIVGGIALLVFLTTRFVQWDLFNLGQTFEKIFTFLVWPYGQNVPFYPLLPYLTPLLILLSIIGILFLLSPLLKKAKNNLPNFFYYKTEVNQKPHFGKLIVYYILVLVAVRLFADSTLSCLLGPCRRSTPGLTIILFAAAGIGLYALIHFLTNYITRLESSKINIINSLLFIGLLAFLGNQIMNEPFTHSDGLYHNIELNEVSALEWIKEYSNKNDVIFASPWAAKAVHLISDRKVNETGVARLGKSMESLEEVIKFPTLNCSEKEFVFEKYKSSILYAGEGIVNCNSFDKLYSKGGISVYVPNK